MAYIEGYMDAKRSTYEHGCMAGHTYKQLISAYAEWMGKHPESNVGLERRCVRGRT